MAHPEHGIFVFVERADGRLYSIHAGKATLLAEGRMVLAFTEDGLEALVKNQGHAVVARRNDLGKSVAHAGHAGSRGRCRTRKGTFKKCGSR